uniref:HDC03437 n=1 Tax=Drosophila melanogaster TaxID=7227 RepID=Q6IH37_DROME|nr:TPA_inf: HDC03437 [Drosophila melanogaster]
MALASSSGFLLQSSAPEFLPARNLKSCGNPGWAAGRLCSRGPGSLLHRLLVAFGKRCQHLRGQKWNGPQTERVKDGGISTHMAQRPEVVRVCAPAEKRNCKQSRAADLASFAWLWAPLSPFAPEAPTVDFSHGTHFTLGMQNARLIQCKMQNAGKPTHNKETDAGQSKGCTDWNRILEKMGLLTYKHEKQEIEFSTLASVRARKEEPEQEAAAQEQLMPRHLCVMRIAPAPAPAPAAVQLLLGGGNYCQRRTRSPGVLKS